MYAPGCEDVRISGRDRYNSHSNLRAIERKRLSGGGANFRNIFNASSDAGGKLGSIDYRATAGEGQDVFASQTRTEWDSHPDVDKAQYSCRTLGSATSLYVAAKK